jgi:hypothetical protein
VQKLPRILTIGYWVLVVLSAIPFFVEGDAMAGILAVILTAPWSSWLGNLMPASGSIFAGLLLLAISAGINAAIIYYASSWIVKRFGK